MKKFFVLLTCVSFGVQLEGQVATQAGIGNHAAVSVPQGTPYAIVRDDANSRTLERTTYEQGPSGKVRPRSHRIVELATGLNYINSQTGQWMPSKEEIDLLPDGTAAATQGQHQVYFPANIYNGAIEVVTSDGRHLKSRPVGVSYDDGNNTVLIAQLKNSVGEIVGSNQVVYPDAFTGIKADLRYTYTRAGFEQDVILREQPPRPADFGLKNTRVQLLTEFFDAGEPVQKVGRADANGLTDTELTFGTMRMKQGKAFCLGEGADSQNQIPVSKSWLKVNGRTLLVEQLTFDSISGQMRHLPTASATTTPSPTEAALCKVSKTRLLPPMRSIQRNELAVKGEKSKVLHIAKADSTPGFVLDYVEVNGSYDTYTFSPGTYFISGPVLCGGATFEGGAVIKYPNDTSAYIEVDSSASFACETEAYNPAVFTAADDDSVGESIAGVWLGYTGTIQAGGYADPALRFALNTLHDARISYAKQAVAVFWGAGVTISDCQFVNCSHGIGLEWQGGVANIKNCLFANPTIDAIRGGGSGSAFNLYFCTFDNCPQLAGVGDDGTLPESVYAVDSIFTSVADFGYGTRSGGYNGFCDTGGNTFGDNPITTDDRTAVYDTNDPWWYGYEYVNYYLYGGSPFSQVGTTDPAYVLDPAVLADISKKVTWFPQVFDSDEDITLGPGPGDSSATPDLGYHYDRIDYIYGDYNGASYLSHHVTFSAGTRVAWAESLYRDPGQGQGVLLGPGAQISFQGTEQNPCYFVRGNNVWEQDTGGDGAGINSTNISTPSIVDANFTHFSTVDDFDALGSSYGSLIFSATNCEFLNASFGACYGFTPNLFNCLLVNNYLNPVSTSSSATPSLSMENCTEVGGFISVFCYSSAPPINVGVTNCAFDGTTIRISANDDSSVFCENNAYVSGDNEFPNDTADVFVTGGYNWQVGPLGNYYLPTDSLLINHGDTTADKAGNTSGGLVGLYHFTTQQNQAKELNSVVDIGYHYVALNANGNAVDTDSDGIPDYMSHDSDGDGLSDALELQLGTGLSDAYSQDPTHTHKDGEWYLTSATDETGTRMQIAFDTKDSGYDGTFTYLYFDVTGGTPGTYDIYFQTPSTDPSDSSQVWQDMFADFGATDLGSDGNGGELWEVVVNGFVPYDGSVQFAALDNQDRDFDGLPDGYEAMAAHTVIGDEGSLNNGVADGDGDVSEDGLSNQQKWQFGLNPLVAVTDTDSDGNGLPDWFDNYIKIWWGDAADTAWGDADGDHLPNIVEYEMGTDPTIQDYWGALPPPGGGASPNGMTPAGGSGDESLQFVSLTRTASYGASEGPNNNPYFPYFSGTGGPLGEGCMLNIETTGSGAGTATLDFEVLPLDLSYNVYAPFTATADPSQGEAQEPDPLDGDLYRHLLLESPHIGEHLWNAIDENVLELLHSQTLEYVHVTSMMRVQYEYRRIQWLEYEIANEGEQAGLLLRIERCENVIEAETTKIVAIDVKYVNKFPDLEWVDRCLKGAGFLSCAIAWYEEWPDLKEDWEGYRSDVRNQINTAGADLLSCQVQSMLLDIPGIPAAMAIELEPSHPIFSPNPLGWYEGY